MTEVDERARYASITAGARVFALIVLAAPVAFTGDYGPILNVILLAAVWMAAIFLEGMHRVPVLPALVIESSLVSFLAALTLADSDVLVPAMVIPLFIAGLVRGSRGMLEVLGAQIVVLAACLASVAELSFSTDLIWVLFTWLMVGLGFGASAAIVHNLRAETPDTTTSYRDARGLINQLIELSGDLVDGLDPVSISQNILDLTREEVPLTGAVVYTGSVYGVTPLLEGDVVSDGVEGRDELVEAVFAAGRPVRHGDEVAFPLSTDVGVVAVVAGAVNPVLSPAGGDLEATLRDLTRKFGTEAVQLDTALLFTTIRDEATAEERHRLARDLHDGVAQDLAALGYLIDGISDTATDAEQVEQIDELRGELSKVVTELRRSIFSLRNEAVHGQSLGESIRALAGHIQSRAGIPVEVELDETGSRLRPGIEAELLRIAQEGMNNAVKHARASRILVTCRVQAPYALVTVSDDGRGLQGGRDDSHGLRIMRERARRIGAVLDLHNVEGNGGVELRVELDATRRSPAVTAPNAAQ
ncbi:sensor histidine kinase [Nocardioides jensenii]|uniref:sensor histidine kinase n=1 Tax=Nocardioides jensenii TaxID=1843 RepID=UPI0008357F38|nr:sensor histidine kinase [Nocardioides jensenii]